MLPRQGHLIISGGMGLSPPQDARDQSTLYKTAALLIWVLMQANVMLKIPLCNGNTCSMQDKQSTKHNTAGLAVHADI